MPISKEEFEQGRLDFTLHALAVLQASPREAFRFEEIRMRIRGRLGGLLPNEQDLALVLRTLEAGGRIRRRMVGENEYFTIVDGLPL